MRVKDIFDRLLHNFSDLLKNGSKRWSSLRFAFLLSVVISNLAVFGVWVGLSIASNIMLSIPESVIVLYCAANGISLTGKLVQKPMEKKADKPNDTQI